MKIRFITAALILIPCICLTAFGQKCKEKLPEGPGPLQGR
jgi:hypothetical protein